MADNIAAVSRSRVLPRVCEALRRCHVDRWEVVADLVDERALQQAEILDQTVSNDSINSTGPLDELHGLPFLAKNLFDVQGLPTLAGGPRLASGVAAESDAEAVAALTRAGAVLVGTTHMDEYAYGFLGVSAHHGSVLNPHTPEAITGGSSSGSAAAVAAGLVDLALGSDTNGSIRVPAALCGVYGFKPAFDVVSRVGMRSLAPSLDHVGWVGASIDIIAAANRVLTGGSSPAENVAIEPRINLISGEFAEWVNEDVWLALNNSISGLMDLRRLELRGLLNAYSAASTITGYEAAAVHRASLAVQPERYSANIAARLRQGAGIPPEVYQLALAERERLREQYLEHFEADDVLIVPVLAMPAPKVGCQSVSVRGLELRVADALGLLVRPFSLAGLPVLTVPIPSPDLSGLALQLIARPGSESALCAAAQQIETRINQAGRLLPTSSRTARIPARDSRARITSSIGELP